MAALKLPARVPALRGKLGDPIVEVLHLAGDDLLLIKQGQQLGTQVSQALEGGGMGFAHQGRNGLGQLLFDEVEIGAVLCPLLLNAFQQGDFRVQSGELLLRQSVGLGGIYLRDGAVFRHAAAVSTL